MERPRLRGRGGRDRLLFRLLRRPVHSRGVWIDTPRGACGAAHLGGAILTAAAPQTLPEAVELVADRSWWFSTLLGIFAGGVSLRRQRARVAALEGAEEIGAEEDLDGPTRAQALAQAREKLLLAQISQLKLALDLVPSTEYAFEPGLPPICVTLASLLSGLLSTYKMFRVGPPPALCDE